MESILEQQRKAHEEIERLEQAIVDQFIKESKSVGLQVFFFLISNKIFISFQTLIIIIS
jgi:hypothetical protein